MLDGTTSIENSEKISAFLKSKGIQHTVLNAKHHEQEAQIVAHAGEKGAITIATNMAGRGTDIVLGDGVKELGGLHIIGTERHESRRIDNQLRGRSGRQGDPGSSSFFLSLEDDLLRIFGSEKIKGMMETLGIEENEAIEHKFITKAIENAQKKVEGRNFDIRRHLLEYDDVMNIQRKIIYQQRTSVLKGENLREEMMQMSKDVAEGFVDQFAPEGVYPEEWNLEELCTTLQNHFALPIILEEEGKVLKLPHLEKEEKIENMEHLDLLELVHEGLDKFYEDKVTHFGNEIISSIEQFVMLQVIDTQWKDHLLNMDHLQQSVGLRGYAQKNPVNEYKKEGLHLFEEMIERIKHDISATTFKAYPAQNQTESDFNKKLEEQQEHQQTRELHGGGEKQRIAEAKEEAPQKTVRRETPKVGRNDPCPCGSGKKFKKCCGHQ